MSFVKYLTYVRVEKAKELLETGKYKVHEVAEMVGYQDAGYFTKVFKKETGVLPKQYARSGE